MRQRRVIPSGLRRDISLRQVAPNVVTATALCFGLTAVRFAMSGEWEKAAGCILLSGVLDGLDGRIARLLRGESRFGAELDSLSDSIAFGVAPAFILYLWSLSALPKFGWLFALAHALMCALRLARFNAMIDTQDQPHKRAGFLTGVPAPAGAGLALLPLFAWLATGENLFRAWFVVAPWVALVAFLMISNVATFSWGSLRLRKRIRLEAIAFAALFFAALVSAPWWTLIALCGAYLLMIPFGMVSYARARARAEG